MPKFLIELSDSRYDYRIYETREQWDADAFSKAGYEREYNAYNYRQGQREYSGSIMRYSSEPDQFPCIALFGGTRYNPNGPDEIEAQFLYDFQQIDE
jgi:hypothetical protein